MFSSGKPYIEHNSIRPTNNSRNVNRSKKKIMVFSISSHEIYRLPCIGVCSIDEESGYCLGCSRTEEEVYKWEDPNTTDEWKKKNEEELKNR